MMCTECDFKANSYRIMLDHYKKEHVYVKNVSGFFTKGARTK